LFGDRTSVIGMVSKDVSFLCTSMTLPRNCLVTRNIAQISWPPGLVWTLW
jgi:hypothetical protein